MPDLKTTFIQRCLAEYMQAVDKGIKAAAKLAGVGVTNEAVNSISYTVLQQGGGAVANLSFYEYLRFVDMGAGRAHPLGGLSTMAVTLRASKTTGLAQVKDKVRKPKKVYSKTAYGLLNWLESKLLYGYTDEAIALLKAELEQTSGS